MQQVKIILIRKISEKPSSGAKLNSEAKKHRGTRLGFLCVLEHDTFRILTR